MKHGKCRKCRKPNWLEKHHIYPQSQFEDEQNTIYICPNCHTDLHQKMGKLKDNDKEFYTSFHLSWLWGIIILFVVICLTLIF